MSDWNSLTEAEINGFRTEFSRKEVWIDVTCKWEGEERKQIFIQGVDDLVVNDVRLSNIIDRIIQWGVADSEVLETKRRLFLLMRGRDPGAGDLEWPDLLERLERLRVGTLTLMEIEPVYGAGALILAESFQLRQRE